MKQNKAWLLMLAVLPFVLLSTSGCIGVNRKAKEHNMKQITAEELNTKMQQNKDLTVINVLAKEAYDDCRIKDSINIPIAKLPEQTASWPKDKEIYVYCASYTCHASAEAYNKLTELGFTNVTAYEGGMKEWREKNFASEGPCSANYLK